MVRRRRTLADQKDTGGSLLREDASSVAKAMEDETKAKLPAPLGGNPPSLYDLWREKGA
jgi:hypothetical protein